MQLSDKDFNILKKAASEYRKELQKEMDKGPESMAIYPGEVEVVEAILRREQRKQRDEIPELSEEESRRILLRMEDELRRELGLPVYEEPTEEAKAPAPILSAADPFTVRTLERIQDDAYTRLNINSRPEGAAFVYMVLDMARDILNKKLYKRITPAVLEKLTEDNYHSARHAAEVVRHLEQYS